MSHLEVEHQVVKLEQVVKVELKGNWTRLCRNRKQSSNVAYV